MTALLTDNLPLLAGAPNGIKKLRELILELAVRGKLVEQDACDEPASELLKSIAAEKAQLIAKGKIKKQKPLAPIREGVLPFEIPASWAYSRLSEITTKLTDGSHNPPKDSGIGFPMLSSRDVTAGNIRFDNPSRYLSADDFDSEDARTRTQPGDVLLTIVASLGRSAVVPINAPKFALQRSVAVLASRLYPAYLSNLLNSPVSLRYYDAHAKGTAQKGIYLGKLGEYVLPVPPLAEQHRIVAKVDELMTLCDRLETQQADAASAHAQLVQALLSSLTQTSDATEFAANWQRLAEHFHTLFTTEPSIDALKQTLLQLAVMGKLVPQDPADESPAKYLDLIASSKEKLLQARRVKYRAVTESAEIQVLKYEIPATWLWMPFRDVVFFQEGPGIRNWQFKSEGVKLLNVSNIGFDDRLDLMSSDKHVSYDEFNQKYQHFLIEEGDLLFAGSGASWGKVAWYEDPGYPVILNTSTMRLCFFCSKFSANYLFYFTKSNFFREQLVPQLAGLQPNFGSTHLSRIYIPVPPIAEQHRIVAKLDQLMALCDQLKTQLSQARQLNQQLASTLVEQAVA